MNFEEEFFTEFGDKYKDLQLQTVVVKKREGVCTATFLYPSTVEELTESDKKEISDFLERHLGLEQLKIRTKFMRAFVEERLILKAIKSFFEERYKLMYSYLHDENFKIEITEIDVQINITVSERIFNFFEEHGVATELSKHLKNNFLCEFVVSCCVSEDFVDEVDIENVEITAKYKVAKRYSVEIVKDCIGKNIPTKPEYINNIKSPKMNVVVAGFINKITRHDFVRKSGAKAGTEGVYYTFVLEDERGKIDCIHFCSKSNLRQMEALEDCMYMLVHGDVEKSKFSGKLVLRVDKMALANKLEEIEFIQKPKKTYSGSVVKVEKLESLEQDSMFGQKIEYNDLIKGKSIVVFDLETTGFDKYNDQIIDIGAVKIVDGIIKEKFASLVKPTIRISQQITELTNITNGMVENAPSIEPVIVDFFNFSKDCALCGHNMIDFDFPFVKRYEEILDVEFDNELIDTYKLAIRKGVRSHNFKLGTLCEYFGISLVGAHRAWNDAYATAQLLLKLCEK